MSGFDDNKSSRDRDRKRKRSTSRSRDRSRSRSRSRSRDRKHHTSHSKVSESDRRTNIKRERKSRWSDAPQSPSSENKVRESNFSAIPSSIENLPSNDIITINEKLKQINPLLALTSQAESSVNPNILYTLNDNSKIKRKVYIPKVPGVNFVGLLIGPKGTYQKRLETQSNCKILIRGKGTQKEGLPPQLDDNEDQHVLIVGDTEENVNKAQFLIEKVLYSDNDTRNRIKEEQLKASQEIRSESFFDGGLPPQIEDHLMTPYGPPDKSARIIPVPNDCVGLIIGKNGDTIRRLHRETGCKIQIAKKEIPNTEVRNVFIEGPPEKYEFARKSIEDIVAEQQKLKANMANIAEKNPFPGPYTYHKVPNRHVGLIIGKNGETLKSLHQKTNCFIYIPNDYKPGDEFRNIELSGNPQAIEECKKEIDALIANVMSVSNDSLNMMPMHPDPYGHQYMFPGYPPFMPYGMPNMNNYIPPKLEDASGTRPPHQGAIQPGMGPMIPQMQPNMMYPPGAHMLPPQNYQAMHPMSYNPHFIPPYPMPQIPGYPPNIVNMNYMTPPSNNGINSQFSVSPTSTSTTAQANIDNRLSTNENKENSDAKDEKKNDSKTNDEEEKNKAEKEKSKNSMLSYIYGGQI